MAENTPRPRHTEVEPYKYLQRRKELVEVNKELAELEANPYSYPFSKDMDKYLEKTDQFEARLKKPENQTQERQQELGEELKVMISNENRFVRENKEIQRRKAWLTFRRDALEIVLGDCPKNYELQIQGNHITIHSDNAVLTEKSTEASLETTAPQPDQTELAKSPTPGPSTNPPQSRHQRQLPDPRSSRVVVSEAEPSLNPMAPPWNAQSTATASDRPQDNSRQIQAPEPFQNQFPSMPNMDLSRLARPNLPLEIILAIQQINWRDHISSSLPAIQRLAALHAERNRDDKIPIWAGLTCGGEKKSEMKMGDYMTAVQKQTAIEEMSAKINSERFAHQMQRAQNKKAGKYNARRVSDLKDEWTRCVRLNSGNEGDREEAAGMLRRFEERVQELDREKETLKQVVAKTEERTGQMAALVHVRNQLERMFAEGVFMDACDKLRNWFIKRPRHQQHSKGGQNVSIKYVRLNWELYACAYPGTRLDERYGRL